MSILHKTATGSRSADDLTAIVDSLQRQRTRLANVPIEDLLTLCDDFARRLIADPRVQSLEGLAFLAAWLRRPNLRKLLELNLNGNLAYLDGFVAHGHDYLAAKPHGLVAMWMAGNVATLPVFSLIPALLTKNVCLMKLAAPDPEGMDGLLAVLAESESPSIRGEELLQSAAIVWFDHHDQQINEQMSLAADAKVIWGGAEAVRAITVLPRREHCVEIVFGPKYSIAVIGSKLLESEGDEAEVAVAALVRDIAIFDQRACSAPQTIFIERNRRHSLDDIGQMFARHFRKLKPKPGLDAYTTLRILNARAEYSLDPSKDVIASTDGANWTVCMDRCVTLKEAVQSRTIFLTEIASWREVIPLVSPKVQTIGIALGDVEESHALAEAATQAGAARCVRPGLMNGYESPWDGKLFVNQLVRWVTLKP